MNILLIAVRLDPAGDKRSVFITAHIISEDKSTGVPRALKLWERQAMLARFHPGTAHRTTFQQLHK